MKDESNARGVEERYHAPVSLRVPGRWTQGRIVLVGACLFLSGMIAGGSLIQAWMSRKDIFPLPEQVPDLVVARMKQDLALTDQQAVQVLDIVRRHHGRMLEIRQKVAPETNRELQAIVEECTAVFDPKQNARWRRFVAEKRQQLFPGQTRSHSSDGQTLENAREQ